MDEKEKEEEEEEKEEEKEEEENKKEEKDWQRRVEKTHLMLSQVGEQGCTGQQARVLKHFRTMLYHLINHAPPW